MNRIRKAAALGVLVAALCVVAVTTVGVSPAGAQTPVCVYEVSPPVLPQTGGTVVINGTAPGSSLVQIFFDPVGPAPVFIAVSNVPTDPVTGAFSASFFTTVTGEVTVGVDGYAELVCIGNAGTNAGAGGAGRSLPRTGANHVRQDLLLGVAAIALGTVMVMGTRRLGRIRGRG